MKKITTLKQAGAKGGSSKSPKKMESLKLNGIKRRIKSIPKLREKLEKLEQLAKENP